MLPLGEIDSKRKSKHLFKINGVIKILSFPSPIV